MSDKWSMTLADVRQAFSELIAFYREMMHARERPLDHQIEAARRYQSSLNDYLRLLNVTEVQRELEQTQRILGRMRSDLPDPFESDEGDPG